MSPLRVAPVISLAIYNLVNIFGAYSKSVNARADKLYVLLLVPPLSNFRGEPICFTARSFLLHEWDGWMDGRSDGRANGLAMVMVVPPRVNVKIVFTVAPHRR